MNHSKIDVAKKIVWLASYPKSGNTWFRAFLTALLGNGEVNINELKTNGIYSSRGIFDSYTDLDSTYLRDEEVKLLLPEVYCQLAKDFENEKLFIKIHDAYALNNLNQPIVPEAPTLCAIYFIRNPLDVVASFAHHSGFSIDKAIKVMNDPKGSLATQYRGHNTNVQFKQLMLDWSGHVESWTKQDAIPVLVIRYEDMLNDPTATFTKAVEFMDIRADSESITKAIEETSFEKLRYKELLGGFKEKNKRSESFFRSGRAGNWKKELNNTQIETIIAHHKEVMTNYNY